MIAVDHTHTHAQDNEYGTYKIAPLHRIKVYKRDFFFAEEAACYNATKIVILCLL